jgi:hypothetical protein
MVAIGPGPGSRTAWPWIDATARRPDLRAARIAEVVALPAPAEPTARASN